MAETVPSLELPTESVAAPQRAAIPQALALTILYHPDDPARVGDRAIISRQRLVEISRRTPRFVHPVTGRGRALRTPKLSRGASRLRRGARGGFSLEPPANHQEYKLYRRWGVPSGHRVGPTDVQEGGVLLELGVILLLLQRVPHPLEAARDYRVLGVSPFIVWLRELIHRLGPEPMFALLTGETGVGKGLVAEALHDASERPDPLLAVNITAVPAALFESELFGHDRGAFTGALEDRAGRFEVAAGGTLFLDEIGDLPLALQPKLLRALREGEFQRLGSARTLRVRARVITATSRDLDGMVADGRFKRDLRARLGLEIRIPPLRERREDIAILLARLFAETPAARAAWGTLGCAGMRALLGEDWLGNVPDLRTRVERCGLLRNLGPPPGSERVEGDPPPGADDEELLLSVFRTCSSLGDAAWALDRGGEEDAARDLIDGVIRERMRSHRFSVDGTARAIGMSSTRFRAQVEALTRRRFGKDLGAEEIEAARRATGGDIGSMAELLEVSKRALDSRMTALGLGERAGG